MFNFNELGCHISSIRINDVFLTIDALHFPSEWKIFLYHNISTIATFTIAKQTYPSALQLPFNLYVQGDDYSSWCLVLKFMMGDSIDTSIWVFYAIICTRLISYISTYPNLSIFAYSLSCSSVVLKFAEYDGSSSKPFSIRPEYDGVCHL